MKLPRVAIGIDLGTTWSCVGICQNGRVTIIDNDNGNDVTPSYVAFTDTERLVGDAAKNQATLNSRNTIVDVKRLLGRKFGDPRLRDDIRHWPFKVVDCEAQPMIEVDFRGEVKRFTPEEMSSMILTKMKETAETFLGVEVQDAVITVPSNFTDSQRQATMDAATISGLNVLCLLNETTATALTYDYNNNFTRERNVFICDLGAGSFDMSILTIGGGSQVKVRATAGDTQLGGLDFDNRLVAHFTQEFEHKFKTNLSGNPRAVRRLRVACEGVKRNLSSSSETTLDIDALIHGLDFYTKISRARFEELCLDLFRSTMDLVEKVLSDSGVNKDDIHDMILIGGSSKIPKLQSLIHDFFHGVQVSQLNVNEPVTFGAALQAAICSGDSVLKNICVTDVAPLSIGIESACGFMTRLVERNSSIPSTHQQMFTTFFDDQPIVSIQVFEGERVMSTENNSLGVFDLIGIPPAPKGVPAIQVTFDMDANGTFSVSAQCTTDNSSIVVESDKGRLSKQDIERLRNEAIKYKAEDETQRDRMAVKGQLELYLYEVKEMIQQVTDTESLDSTRKRNILQKCSQVLKWLDNDQMGEKEDYESQLSQLQLDFEPILMSLHEPHSHSNGFYTDENFNHAPPPLDKVY